MDTEGGSGHKNPKTQFQLAERLGYDMTRFSNIMLISICSLFWLVSAGVDNSVQIVTDIRSIEAANS